MTTTLTTATCPSTTPLTDAEAIDMLVAAGLVADIDTAARTYKGWYGRKMCANPDCCGAVLPTRSGIRKHVLGSNLTEAERVALVPPARPMINCTDCETGHPEGACD